jgi:hypothetical protein
MEYEPRTIAFLTEIFHPPVAHDARRLQSVHAEVFSNSSAGYRNFNLVPGGACLANPLPQAGAVSAASFLADRVQIREEGTGVGVEEFAARLDALGRLSMERLGLQVFVAQQVTVRSLVNPRRERDSRLFLSRDVLRLPPAASEAFGRATRLVGLRFVLPGVPEDPGTYNLRIESYDADPRSLFLEVVGTFPPILPANGVETIVKNLRTTYRFLVERACVFVESFET